MAQDDNFDWIFDFVMEVLKSPEWEVPVMSFIDTNCAVFDSEDENKLAYTDVHSSFRQVVDDVLTQKLAEVGVSAEDFAKACEVASEKKKFVCSPTISPHSFSSAVTSSFCACCRQLQVTSWSL